MPDGGVLMFCSDLMFVSKVEVTARALGTPVVFARDGSDVAQRLARERPALVLVDLALKGVDPVALVLALRAASEVEIVAFGSHVDADMLERARAAGATQALPRSAFTRRLPELLRREPSS